MTAQIKSKCTRSKERNAQHGKRQEMSALNLGLWNPYPSPCILTPFPPADQNADADVAHPCWWGPNGGGEGDGRGWLHMSHSERDKAVVSLDVPLENLRARAQHTLEAGPIQLHTLQGSAGDYGGCPGTVQQQGDFAWTRTRRKRQRGLSS